MARPKMTSDTFLPCIVNATIRRPMRPTEVPLGCSRQTITTFALPKTAQKHEPLISVIIPTLNESKNIVSCIQSVRQAFENQRYEIIIVDGGSDDNTTELTTALE